MVYKYYFINPYKKFNIISKSDNSTNLLKETKLKIKNMKLSEDNVIIKLKISKNKDKVDAKSKLKLKSGPIRVDIIIFNITKRKSIKKAEYDKRTNFLFYTEKYLKENGLKEKDFKRIAKAAFLDKLEKKLIAPKLINQIKKIKL